MVDVSLMVEWDRRDRERGSYADQYNCCRLNLMTSVCCPVRGVLAFMHLVLALAENLGQGIWRQILSHEIREVRNRHRADPHFVV